MTSVTSLTAMTFLEGGAGDDTLSTTEAGGQVANATLSGGEGDDAISGFDLDALSSDDDMLIFRGIAGLDDRSDLSVSGDSTHGVFSFGGQSVRIDGKDAANAGDGPVFFSA